jgi:uncharacterized membrane protein YphA (DoxX/SURF4 family)
LKNTTEYRDPGRQSGALNGALWIAQILLALLFLFAGVMKFVTPVEVMTEHSPLSGTFLHFIGVVEVFGAVGLILPWLLRISPMLTPIAAGGLVIIMLGATVITAMTMSVAVAIAPLVVGVVCAFVAYGRSGRAAQWRGLKA